MKAVGETGRNYQDSGNERQRGTVKGLKMERIRWKAHSIAVNAITSMPQNARFQMLKGLEQPSSLDNVMLRCTLRGCRREGEMDD